MAGKKSYCLLYITEKKIKVGDIKRQKPTLKHKYVLHLQKSKLKSYLTMYKA